MRRLQKRRNDTCFDCLTTTHCVWHGDLDEIAWDEFERRIGCIGAHLEVDAFAEGVEWGAGWMYAIIAMAQSIHDSHLCRSCIYIHSADDDGTCQKCGYPHGHWPLDSNV